MKYVIAVKQGSKWRWHADAHLRLVVYESMHEARRATVNVTCLNRIVQLPEKGAAELPVD